MTEEAPKITSAVKTPREKNPVALQQANDSLPFPKKRKNEKDSSVKKPSSKSQAKSFAGQTY